MQIKHKKEKSDIPIFDNREECMFKFTLWKILYSCQSSCGEQRLKTLRVLDNFLDKLQSHHH